MKIVTKTWVIDLIKKALAEKQYPRTIFNEFRAVWHNDNRKAFYTTTQPADNQWTNHGDYLEDLPPTAAGRSNCIYTNLIDFSDYREVIFTHILNGVNMETKIDVSDITTSAYIVCGSFVNSTETQTPGGFYITNSLDYYAENDNVLKSVYFDTHIVTWLVYDIMFR